MNIENIHIAVIGLGYVGLPLAGLFSTKYNTIGYDCNEQRVKQLNNAKDENNDIDPENLKKALESGLRFTDRVEDIRDCNFYVVSVPTPVDACNRVDLKCLLDATTMIGGLIKKNDIVVYESTVYPGMTEEECIPVIEKISSLRYNKDFFAGYSPERINPGDKQRTVQNIQKVTSGSTPEIADYIDKVYSSVLKVPTYKAPSIKVAEAAKIIENTQRDVNIAFMNELAKIFNVMGIDTNDVLQAASSKWNFVSLHPGLVGGHCISVDPYYLIQKAEVYGYMPRLITNARNLNDSMGGYVASRVIECMNKKGVLVKDCKILVLGFTFKENCSDIRNTKVVDICNTFSDYTSNITIFDPWVDRKKAMREYGLKVDTAAPEYGQFDTVILCVAHKDFENMDPRKYLKDYRGGVVYDVKGFFDRKYVDERL